MAEVSANALVQETESSSIQIGVDHERIAEISANEELAPTEDDNAPRWLSKCPRNRAGRFVAEEAWVAAIESAHGQGQKTLKNCLLKK